MPISVLLNITTTYVILFPGIAWMPAPGSLGWDIGAAPGAFFFGSSGECVVSRPVYRGLQITNSPTWKYCTKANHESKKNENTNNTEGNGRQQSSFSCFRLSCFRDWYLVTPRSAVNVITSVDQTITFKHLVCCLPWMVHLGEGSERITGREPLERRKSAKFPGFFVSRGRVDHFQGRGGVATLMPSLNLCYRP